MRNRQSRQAEYGFEVDVIDLIPDGIARGLERPVTLHAGIVAERIQLAEAADGSLHCLYKDLHLTKIADHKLDLAACRAETHRKLFELSAVAIEKSELRPALGKK